MIFMVSMFYRMCCILFVVDKFLVGRESVVIRLMIKSFKLVKCFVRLRMRSIGMVSLFVVFR